MHVMHRPLLELKAVTRCFGAHDHDAARVLKAIDLTIHAGEFVAIVGASGSGKSTLMNILGCLDHPSSGSYKVAGRETASLTHNELARLRCERFGFIFQRYHLLSYLSAADNVAMPAVYAGMAQPARAARARALLQRLGLGERAQHRPAQLSGGQQQRVSIARALMNGGAVILADEPTGALDRRSGQQVIEILGELNAAGATIILVTHDQQIAARARRIVEISDGRIVDDRANPAAQSKRRAETGNQTAVLTVLSGQPAQTPHNGAKNGPRPAFHALLCALIDTRLRRFIEAFRMAAAALLVHRLRTLLTMLGIVIGITAVVCVVALGEGAKRALREIIRGMGTNTITIFPGRDRGERRWGNIRSLAPADLDALRAQPYADSVTPEIARVSIVRYRNIDLNATIVGVSTDYFRVRAIKIAQGAPFQRDDIQRQAQVVVIDPNTRRKLFGAGVKPLGQTILIANLPCTVIGVAQPKKSLFGAQENPMIWMPYSTANDKLFGQRHFNKITVRLAEGWSSRAAEQGIEKLLQQRHGGKDFFTFNMDSMLKAQERNNRLLALFLSLIAAISLLVGGIGVMNIMLVSVIERTREIGIRIAVGARQSDIMQQFLVEAVTVCLLSGVIGIALSFGVGFVFSLLVSRFKMIFSAGSISAAFICSTLIGVIFGFMPARRAAQLNPADALARD